MVIINYDDHYDSHRTYPASAAQLIQTGSLNAIRQSLLLIYYLSLHVFTIMIMIMNLPLLGRNV